MSELRGDVIERSWAIPFAMSRAGHAVASDPVCRALPSDELARRCGVRREDAERDLRALVRHFTGIYPQIAGLSFDDAIAEVGQARRSAMSPEPLNEAAGFVPRFGRPPPGRASFVKRQPAPQLRQAPMSVATGGTPYAPPRYLSRSVRRFGASGFEFPPVPDLSIFLLSDIFPVTKRIWSTGPYPTADEVQILNWQHPLIANAQSAASTQVINEISQGARSWDQDVTLPGGRQLSKRSDDERAQWWSELQVLAQTQYSKGDGPKLQQWLAPPRILPPKDPDNDWPETVAWIEWWDCSDARHPRWKFSAWNLDKLGRLNGDNVLKAVIAPPGLDASSQCEVQGDGVTVKCGIPGGDVESEAYVLLPSLLNAMGSLTTAISAVLSVYCPACGVAFAIASKVAVNAAKNAAKQNTGGRVATLQSYGDLMLRDAATRSLAGDSSVYQALQQFAGALIGLPVQSAGTAQPQGGIVSDYLATLGTSYGNVPAALLFFAQARGNRISSAADLASQAGIPFEDCQYAVAAMTDTLARFSTNLHTIYHYTPPCEFSMVQAGLCSFSDMMIGTMNDAKQNLQLFGPGMMPSQLPAIGPNVPPKSSPVVPLAIGAGLLGLAKIAGYL